MTATEMMSFAAAEAAVDALALVIALRLLGHAVRPVRVAAGAAEGALLACLCAWAAPGRAVQLAYWLPAAMLMMLTADALAWRHPLRSAAVLLAACGLLGGVVQALCGATGSPAAAWMTGGAFSLAAAAYLRRRRRGEGRARLMLTAGGKTAAFDAIIDSGNTLRDYLTRRPVIVLAQEDVRAKLGEGIGLRPIFADTAGGRQMMWCFLPDRALLQTDDGARTLCAAAALSPGLRRGAPALIPGSLWEE